MSNNNRLRAATTATTRSSHEHGINMIAFFYHQSLSLSLSLSLAERGCNVAVIDDERDKILINKLQKNDMLHQTRLASCNK